MKDKCTKYEALFTFSDEEYLKNHLKDCEECQKEQEKMDKVSKLLEEVVIYVEIYGYTYEECAKKFKCPVGTIKSRLYNAKKELANKLSDLL